MRNYLFPKILNLLPEAMVLWEKIFISPVFPAGSGFLTEKGNGILLLPGKKIYYICQKNIP
jgi:hypothetical protein